MYVYIYMFLKYTYTFKMKIGLLRELLSFPKYQEYWNKPWHQSCCFDLQMFVFLKLLLSPSCEQYLILVIGPRAVAPKLLLWLANVCVLKAAAFCSTEFCDWITSCGTKAAALTCKRLCSQRCCFLQVISSSGFCDWTTSCGTKTAANCRQLLCSLVFFLPKMRQLVFLNWQLVTMKLTLDSFEKRFVRDFDSFEKRLIRKRLDSFEKRFVRD